MIFIFLDIDGVLSTLTESMESTKDFWIINRWARDLGVLYSFNEGCVDIFNDITSQFECEIILSSDWKKKRSLKDLDIIFKENNVTKSPVDKTKDLRDEFNNFEATRAMEIMYFINENNIKDFIILDDLDLEKLLPPRILDRFFKTPFDLGISEPGMKEKIIERMKLFK
jgi:hypothetical protein